MITYEIVATVAPELVPRFEAYMREDHIPALLATGYFVTARFTRGGPGEYRIQYDAPDRATLERYLAERSPMLRKEFTARFPAGVEMTRTVWEVLQAWR